MCFYLWLFSVFIKKSYKIKEIDWNGKWIVKEEKQTGAISQKSIAAAILRDIDSFWFRFVDWKTHLIDYFGEYHQMVEMVEKAN